MTFPESIHPHWKLPYVAMKIQLFFSNDQVIKLSEGGTNFSRQWPLQDAGLIPPVWGSCSVGDAPSGWHDWNNLGKGLELLPGLWEGAKAEIWHCGVRQAGRLAISSCGHLCLCCKLVSVSLTLPFKNHDLLVLTWFLSSENVSSDFFL